MNEAFVAHRLCIVSHRRNQKGSRPAHHRLLTKFNFAFMIENGVNSSLIGCSFCKTFNSRDNRKTVGAARQQRQFLCGVKANAAKESWRGDMPSARSQGVFAYFCRRRDKSKASGGRNPPVLFLLSSRSKCNRSTLSPSKTT
jgi:hypothetical protein